VDSKYLYLILRGSKVLHIVPEIREGGVITSSACGRRYALANIADLATNEEFDPYTLGNLRKSSYERSGGKNVFLVNEEGMKVLTEKYGYRVCGSCLRETRKK
jgi:hypothetical protein